MKNGGVAMHRDTVATVINSKVTPNQQLADKLHKTLIRKSQNGKGIYSFVKEIWALILLIRS